MAAVRLSRRFILREMVHELGLHLSGYDTHEISRGRFISSVSVRGDVVAAGEQPMLQTCHGLPERSVERAEESCASAAITSIKRTLEVDVDDVNYVQKILLESDNQRYETEHTQNQETMQHLGSLVVEFRDGWECTIKRIEWMMDLWDPSRRNSDEEPGSSTGRISESVAGPQTGDTIPRDNGVSPHEDITKKLSVLHTHALEALEATKRRMSGMGVQLP